VLDFSTSHNLITPSVQKLLPVSKTVSENETKQLMLLLRLSEVRDEFDLSASHNLITFSVSILLSVFGENGTKQEVSYC
jgi:hypothetical protein